MYTKGINKSTWILCKFEFFAVRFTSYIMTMAATARTRAETDVYIFVGGT